MDRMTDACKTRMHSSRMCTGCLLTVCWSLLLGGVLSPRGVYLAQGGVLSPRGVSGPRGCLVLGGVCSGGVWSLGVSAPGGLLLGVSAPGGVCSGGVSALGGVCSGGWWYPSMH